MNGPRALAPSLLSGAAGLALVAGMAFAAPAAAAQQNADPLDSVEQAMSPPPIIRDEDRADDAPPSDIRDNFRWDELDADGDGRISLSEGSANPDFDSNFEMTDADGDGYVTRAEEDASDRENPPEPEEADEQQ